MTDTSRADALRRVQADLDAVLSHIETVPREWRIGEGQGPLIGSAIGKALGASLTSLVSLTRHTISLDEEVTALRKEVKRLRKQVNSEG